LLASLTGVMKKILMAISLCAAVYGQRVPANTTISVRMIDSIDSSKATEGQTFQASVDQDVMVNGRTIVARGANATVTLANLDQSGKFKGNTELAVRLTNVTVNGQPTEVETGEVTKVSSGQGKSTAVRTGIGAGIGAALGAIFGGGKGAAIGAGAGGAAGAGSQVFTKGKKVQIPSETILTFVTTSRSGVNRVNQPR